MTRALSRRAFLGAAGAAAFAGCAPPPPPGDDPPPDAVDQAWTWSEFIDVAREVKRVTGAYGFSVGFGGVNNAYRWLPFLYMHGGRLVEDDLVTPAIENDAGIEALDWTRRWYAD